MTGQQLIRKDYCHQANRVCAGHWCYCPLSNQSFFSVILAPSLSPLVTLLPHPGGSDGWYHHGDGSGSAWTTLLPGGRLREVQGSGRCQGVLRLRSARRSDLVGTKGKFKKRITNKENHVGSIYHYLFLCSSGVYHRWMNNNAASRLWVKCVMTYIKPRTRTGLTHVLSGHIRQILWVKVPHSAFGFNVCPTSSADFVHVPNLIAYC